MNQSQTETLRENRVNIVQDLEPKGTVLDSLYEDGVLTENDVELVSSARTRKERVQALLSILPTRGPVAYGSFQKALKVSNFEDLAELLAPFTDNVDQHNDQIISGVCQPCCKFLERLENCRKKNIRLKELLRWNCCLFLDNIEPKDVIDQLFQDHVINTDDIDKLTSPATRRERCETLIEILLDNLNHSVTDSLKGALTKKYSYIADEISNFEIESQMSPKSRGCVLNTSFRFEHNRKSDDLTQLKAFLVDSSEENERLNELENSHSEPCAGSWKEQKKGTGLNNTQLKKVYEDNLDENSWYRDIDERTASTYTESTELVKMNELKEVAAGKIVDTVTQREKRSETSELKFKIDHDTQCKKVFNKYNESFDERNIHVVKSENAEKCVGTKSVREIEERTASTFCGITPDETKPKAIVSLESNTCTLVREVDERSATEHDSVEQTNALEEKSEIKHNECTCCNQNIASAEEKTPSSKYSNHPTDSVDGAISERRLKVTVLDKAAVPLKSEFSVRTENNNINIKPCLTCATSVIKDKHVKEQADTPSSTYQQKQMNDITSQSKELLPMTVTATHTERPRKRITVAFNYLSTLINQGEFAKFQDISSRLQQQFPTNFDLMCIIGYLKISRDLFQTNFDSAKKKIDETMAIVPKSSNPRYFTLELFTAKTRMYITRKKLEKLQTTLDEAMMILETDPVGCTGRAAGWLYINHARNQTAQLSCLNLRKQGALSTYERLFQSSKSSFQRSMSNFKRDGGKDGPFGFGYALCRLVILLLRCGDNGLTMDVLTPSSDDIRSAGHYLQHLEDSDIVISKILDMHFRLAKCDYQFRRRNYIRAFEHAQIAYDLATEMNLLEFKEHAHNRLAHLRSRTSNVTSTDEMSSAEAEQILFGDSSDNEYSTHSE